MHFARIYIICTVATRRSKPALSKSKPSHRMWRCCPAIAIKATACGRTAWVAIRIHERALRLPKRVARASPTVAEVVDYWADCCRNCLYEARMMLISCTMLKSQKIYIDKTPTSVHMFEINSLVWVSLRYPLLRLASVSGSCNGAHRCRSTDAVRVDCPPQ